MDACRWIVAFLLFTAAFQAAEQRPIIDDSAEFFDVFPGGESTDEVPMNISKSDEISASYKSAATSSHPTDIVNILLDCDFSVSPPECNATASMSEELEYLQNTTQIPSNITSKYEETDKPTHPTVALIIVIAVFVILVVSISYWVLCKYFHSDIDRNPQFPHAFQSIQHLATHRGNTFG